MDIFSSAHYRTSHTTAALLQHTVLRFAQMCGKGVVTCQLKQPHQCKCVCCSLRGLWDPRTEFERVNLHIQKDRVPWGDRGVKELHGHPTAGKFTRSAEMEGEVRKAKLGSHLAWCDLFGQIKNFMWRSNFHSPRRPPAARASQNERFQQRDAAGGCRRLGVSQPTRCVLSE